MFAPGSMTSEFHEQIGGLKGSKGLIENDFVAG